MKRAETVEALRAPLAAWRRGGERIAFVPTMGNLHQGHLELVREARRRGDRVVVSIFVNPLQFGAGEDLDAYPRTPQEDGALLEALGCDLLFLPPVEVMYPEGQGEVTRVEVPALSEILCGASRPGHFSGVATVVSKLFNLVQPDLALFGEKDYQQLAVIRKMVRDLCFPVEIIGVATVREADGLAMSSRNGYLSEEERRRAPLLYRTLQQLRTAVLEGEHNYAALEQQAGAALEQGGFRLDYLSVRRAEDLQPPRGGEGEALIVLAAAWLGKPRLIDNLLI